MSGKGGAMATRLWALVFAAFLLFAPAAQAHHKSGHSKGGAKTTQGGSAKGTQGGSAKSTSSSGTVPDDNDDNAHPSGKDRETNNGPADDAQGNSKSNPDNDGHGPERNSCPGSGEGECVDKPGGDGGVDRDDQDGNNGCGNDDDFEDDNEGWCGKPHDKTKNSKEQRKDHSCENPENMPKGQSKKCESSAPTVCEDMKDSDQEVCGEIADKVDEVCSDDANMTDEGECDKEKAKEAADKVCAGKMTAEERKQCKEVGAEVLGDVETKSGGPGGTSGSGGSSDEVLGSTVSSGSDDNSGGPEVAGATLGSESDEGVLGGALPFTGGEVAGFLLAALALIAGGFVLMRTRRANQH